MLPHQFEIVVLFFGKVYIQDFHDIFSSDDFSTLSTTLRTSVTGSHIEPRASNVNFDRIPPEVYEFLDLLKHLELRPEYARRLIMFDEWWNGLTSRLTTAKVLFVAEEYDLVDKLFLENISADENLKNGRSIWFELIAKIGDYNFALLLSRSASKSEILACLRYSWQKGDLGRCAQICELLDNSELGDEERARYLNNKIRFLRDAGQLPLSQKALDEYYELIGAMRESGSDIEFIASRMATYEYNLAIDAFIRGRLWNCIALCRTSLQSRQDAYSIPYIYLRMARAAILAGNRDEASEFIEKAKGLEIDKWGESLKKGVEAESEFFLNHNLERAKNLWQEGKRLEESVGVTFRYSEIGLALVAIAQADADALSFYELTFSNSVFVEARIIYAFVRATIGITASEQFSVQTAFQEIVKAFKGYDTWLYCGAVALSFIQRDIGKSRDWPRAARRHFRGLDFDLAQFSDGNMRRVPKVFISYSQDFRRHISWCFRLFRRLRLNGVDANIDQAHKGLSTIDFNSFMLKGIRDSDLIIVVLTQKYKKKIEDDVGGASVEFGLLRDEILKRRYERLIFVLRSGSFSETIPFEARGVEQIDFRADALVGGQPSVRLTELLHRIFKVPLKEQVPIGRRPHLQPKQE